MTITLKFNTFSTTFNNRLNQYYKKYLGPVRRWLTAQFHGSVLRPDLTKNSAKRVLKSITPRKQFCLRCTFPRFDTAGVKTFYQRKTWVGIIMKLLTRASRLKLLSRSFWSNQNCYSARDGLRVFEILVKYSWNTRPWNWGVRSQRKIYLLLNQRRASLWMNMFHIPIISILN